MINDVLKQYPFSEEEATDLLEEVLQMATLTNPGMVLSALRLTVPINVINYAVNKHVWTMEDVSALVTKLAPLVDVFTFEGLMARISPLLRGLDDTLMVWQDGRRPCLVNNRKHWFLRWQTRKWVCEPSPMIGGSPGGQCQVTMAIVEEQETGQVSEVYPREVRFLDSVDGQNGEATE